MSGRVSQSPIIRGSPAHDYLCRALLLSLRMRRREQFHYNGKHMIVWNRLLPLLAASMLLASPAHAAFKCVVDGETTCQERPGDDDVKKRVAKK